VIDTLPLEYRGSQPVRRDHLGETNADGQETRHMMEQVISNLMDTPSGLPRQSTTFAITWPY